MIILLNLIIGIIGLGSIILARRRILNNNNWLSFHLVFLTLKLFLNSFIIGLFIVFSEKNIWSILIISGMLNIVSFHFLEAYLTQKQLLHIERVDV
tara:strand:+ start:138 stop:425 length:288 start_codon:yes stop_codon:yes gene_type:complete